MKKIYSLLVSVVFLFTAFKSSSQNTTRAGVTLSGKVTDSKTGTTLISASIYISDLKAGTTSDLNGNYVLHNIPAGTYLIEAGYVGYKNLLKTVTLTENTTLDFAMDISITEVNEVVVTGSSRAMSIRRNPIPIISINKQFLQQNLSTNIIDAIARVPGINAVTTGPNISKPFIRGLGFNRILTLYDGVRQEGQQWGDEHGIEVDQNTVDKVEVVKGPASLIYGSDAVAGVVNLLPPNPPAEGKTIGEIVNEYQTNNRLIQNSAMFAGHNNSLVWMATASHKLATNYTNKIDGRVYNTAFAETDISGLAGINKSWGYSHIGFSIFDDLQSVPNGSRDSASRRFTKQITEADTVRPIVSKRELTSYHIPVLHQHVQHYRLYSANSFRVGDGRLVLNLAYQKSVRREFSHPQIIVPGLYLLLNTFSYDVKYNFAEKNGWGVTAGVNGMYQNNNSEKGTEFIIPSYHQFDVGPFIFIKKTIKDLELAGGLRYDTRSFTDKELFTKPDPVTGFDKPVYGKDTAGADQPFFAYNHIFAGISGSFGLSYRFSDRVSAKFNIGRGFRAPNISEISANGVHPGTNTYQLGNFNFKPEFNLQEDLGVTYSTPHFTLNTEVFNNNITNYIFNSKLLNRQGQDSIIVPGNETFQFLQGKAQLYGAEISLDIHPHPLDWLHFENSLSLVYGTNKNATNLTKINDSSKYLPFIPPLHSFSELRVNIKKVSKGIGNGFIKLQLEHYSAQNRAYLAFGTETPTPGYQLVNAGLGADVIDKKGNVVLTFSLQGNNLFDVAYQSHLNRLKYFEDFPNDPRPYHGIYNMGRNFSIKINVPLNLSETGRKNY
ncbi:MAG: TonB-dependent receptor [Bacteroidota bacterium]|nr:TonB-dependent receptor [Bacteroidota bacterium]